MCRTSSARLGVARERDGAAEAERPAREDRVPVVRHERDRRTILALAPDVPEQERHVVQRDPLQDLALRDLGRHERLLDQHRLRRAHGLAREDLRDAAEVVREVALAVTPARHVLHEAHVGALADADGRQSDAVRGDVADECVVTRALGLAVRQEDDVLELGVLLLQRLERVVEARVDVRTAAGHEARDVARDRVWRMA
jgi:hypothetical protein